MVPSSGLKTLIPFWLLIHRLPLLSSRILHKELEGSSPFSKNLVKDRVVRLNRFSPFRVQTHRRPFESWNNDTATLSLIVDGSSSSWLKVMNLLVSRFNRFSPSRVATQIFRSWSSKISKIEVLLRPLFDLS